MALEKEMSTYEKNLPQWKEYEGKFVLIHGDDVADFFESYEDAMKDAYRRYGVDESFLVKRVRSVETVQYVTRIATPSAS